MSKDNNAALWASRVTKLKEKVEAGEERLEQSNSTASQLIAEEAATQFHYIPTVTREPFRTTRRIGALLIFGPLNFSVWSREAA